ncbi:hypothetical protein [Cohnella fermenti]|uniref:Uncharacterized protein n=1 Tax=Cohnella fermenti TaxID=2565925 RepID=A0A4S4BTK9_9BACL|nr:hypothetical protein [Cohnella fermenti]THF78421.1 hypothetical protein E6C55_14535 [Cohnella fermenti]
MDPTDKELREWLSDGPFPGGGFDERLRRRIEANLDRPPRRARSRSLWTALGASVAVAAALLIGIWQWSDSGTEAWQANRDAEMSMASQPEAVKLAKVEEPLETAMLIGLRKDISTPDGGVVSTYRTILVAPESEDKLVVAAQGDGIVMPYKQSFWFLNATGDDGSSSAQTISAYEAYTSKKLAAVPEAAPVREGLLSERLLYVGHEYLAVAQEGSGAGERRFVQSLKQLSESLGTPYDSSTEPHLSLEAASDDEATEELKEEDAVPVNVGTEQWSIIRKQGSWAGVRYRNSAGYGALDLTSEEETGESLPDKIARNNSLPIDWANVLALEPAATDAYASVNLQVLAVALDRQLKIYPYGRENSAENVLAIDLDPGESVIMVQWSVEQKYTEQWVTKVSEILQAASASGTEAVVAK